MHVALSSSHPLAVTLSTPYLQQPPADHFHCLLLAAAPRYLPVVTCSATTTRM